MARLFHPNNNVGGEIKQKYKQFLFVKEYELWYDIRYDKSIIKCYTMVS